MVSRQLFPIFDQLFSQIKVDIVNLAQNTDLINWFEHIIILTWYHFIDKQFWEVYIFIGDFRNEFLEILLDLLMVEH